MLDLIFTYEDPHNNLHPEGVQQNLEAFDSDNDGIFLYGKYRNGKAVFYKRLEL
jgi:hypothetical protein